MFSFIRLIDGTVMIGNVVDESDQTYIIEDAVELGSKDLNSLERQFFFKNIYSPFSTSSEILTEIYKDHIISIHQDLDTFVYDHWQRYVSKWKSLRGKSTAPIAEDEKISREQIEELKAYLEYQALANTEIH